MSKTLKAWLISFSTLLVLVMLMGVVLAVRYRDTFYPGTHIGSLDLSGKSYADGKLLLNGLVANYSKQRVVVEAQDVTQSVDQQTGTYPLFSVTANADQLGLHFPEDRLISTAWSVGHQHSVISWLKTVPQRIFSQTPIALTYTIDLATVSLYVHTEILPKLATPQAPRVVISTASLVSVSKPAPGLQLDEAMLASRLQSALTTLADGDTIYLEAPTKLANPLITTAMVTPLADQLDALGNLQLTLAATTFTLKPTRPQLLGWFQTIEDHAAVLSLVLNQSAVTSYLTAANPQIDPVASTQAISTVLAPLISSVPTKLTIALVLKKTTSVLPIAGQYTLGREAGKYLEADLHSQRLYRINGQMLEKTYLISSGKASTPTPLGQFTVNGHAKMAFTPLYGLYMPFWMNFKDGLYGLHELPVWPNGYREGANHLGIPVSDGCIRLGLGEAEELYSWTPDGTPLFIH